MSASTTTLTPQETASAQVIKSQVGVFSMPRVVIVLGSGAAGAIDGVITMGSVDFREMEAMPKATVPGHRGRLSWGIWRVDRAGVVESLPVFLAEGRVHLYEGHGAKQVTALVRILASLGVDHLVLTNAAGCVNTNFTPGDWMLISDHLNLTGTSPLEGAPNFIDMSQIYTPGWRDHLKSRVEASDPALREGVYAGLRGPQFETPAEVRMLRTLGADAVGMSTVLEGIQAHALGMKTIGFSCMTNWAAGITQEIIHHQEVLDLGKTSAKTLKLWLTKALEFVPPH